MCFGIKHRLGEFQKLLVHLSGRWHFCAFDHLNGTLRRILVVLRSPCTCLYRARLPFPGPTSFPQFIGYFFFYSSNSSPHRYLTYIPYSKMADDERRAKRSRFDQTEPEPRRSRFDRRSRSPSARQSESTRTRSPLSREARSPAGDGAPKPAVADPAAAAGTSCDAPTMSCAWMSIAC